MTQFYAFYGTKFLEPLTFSSSSVRGPPPTLHVTTRARVWPAPCRGRSPGYATAETEGGTGGRDGTELCHVGRKGHVTDLVPELDSAFKKLQNIQIHQGPQRVCPGGANRWGTERTAGTGHFGTSDPVQGHTLRNCSMVCSDPCNVARKQKRGRE